MRRTSRRPSSPGSSKARRWGTTPSWAPSGNTSRSSSAGSSATRRSPSTGSSGGGGVRVLPLIDDAGSLPDPGAPDPEAAFDRAWWNEVVDLAIEKVKSRHAGDAAFKVYELYDLGLESDRPTYSDLARRLGLSERDVKHHLFAVREELCDEIRAELARQTVSERDLREEWDALFGA